MQLGIACCRVHPRNVGPGECNGPVLKDLICWFRRFISWDLV